jgi:DegV family protein with EDD domain
MKIAVVTDSASDLPPATAAAAGISVIALNVTFGDRSFRAGLDLSTDEFWRKMTAPDAPFPTTSAASPGAFQEAFEAAFAAGAQAVICVDVAETLSGTIKSARIAAGLLPEREIHVIDSHSASMGVGLLALVAVDLAARGTGAAQIAAEIESRRDDVDLFVGLDTLAYLRKGGRLSGPQAAIGTLLSVKPIITVREGKVEVADRPRTRSKARERVLELLSARPLERLAVLFTPPADADTFRDELVGRLPGGINPANVSVQPVGPSVGPHLGPGCLGGVVLYRRD